MKKLTTEQFIERANIIHNNFYSYELSSYVNSSTKLKIICPIHGSFLQRPREHITGRGCKSCGHISTANKKIFTIEKFIERANKIHNNFYGYEDSSYINCKIKMKIVCPLHGPFWQKPDEHYRRGCKKCGYERVSKSLKLTFENFISRANIIHKNFYIYDELSFINGNIKSKILCPVHDSFWQRPVNHLLGIGCAKCGFENVGRQNRSNIEEFIKKAILIHENYYCYSKAIYIDASTKLEIVCPDHGSFWQRPNGHLQGQGCPSCAKRISKSEISWLNSLNIPHDKQHRQVKLALITGKKIQVDGYNPKTNTVYEYCGDYWHGNPKTKKLSAINEVVGKTYKQLNDELFKRFQDIKNSGYKLVYIWEDDFKKGIKS